VTLVQLLHVGQGIDLGGLLSGRVERKIASNATSTTVAGSTER
jgi:hypothetical protein